LIQGHINGSKQINNFQQNMSFTSVTNVCYVDMATGVLAYLPQTDLQIRMCGAAYIKI
jgi:hypothetical protein